MLALAADELETLRRRAAATQQLVHAREDDHARNLELREAAELATENLNAEIAALKLEADAIRQSAATERSLFEGEIRRLQAELGETETRAAQFAAEMQAHLRELGAAAEAHINALAAEVAHLRNQLQQQPTPPQQPQPPQELSKREQPQPSQELTDDTTAVVPLAQLRLARAQFEYLARTFAGNGDVISLTICEIGACAIDKALGADDESATESDKLRTV